MSPNTNGGFACYSYRGVASWGSVSVTQGENQNFSLVLSDDSDNVRNTQVNISPALENAIYSDSVDTVQPQSVRALVLIRSF